LYTTFFSCQAISKISLNYFSLEKSEPFIIYLSLSLSLFQMGHNLFKIQEASIIYGCFHLSSIFEKY